MRKTILTTLSFLSLSFFIYAEEHHHWSYEGETGPQNWSKLEKDYFWCELKNQSPIDISKEYTIKANLPLLKLDYKKVENPEIINNGHTIQVNIPNENKLTEYSLKQFHFHIPSEHTINKKSYPLEIHFVHKDDNNNITVVGVMAVLGKPNPELDKILSVAPSEEKTEKLNGSIDLKKLLPKKLSYYTYSGSLTTPPCTEGVRWIVLKTPITVSKEQLEKLKSIMKIPNNRPTQDIGGREIFESF